MTSLDSPTARTFCRTDPSYLLFPVTKKNFLFRSIPPYSEAFPCVDSSEIIGIDDHWEPFARCHGGNRLEQIMPMVKSFTQAQWDAASRRLDDLPDKPAHEHRVNVQDAIKAMHAQIKSAQNKGYTLEEIVQQFARDGVEISASTLRYAMRRALEGGQPVQADKGRAIAAAAKTNARTHARKTGQADITRDNVPARATGTAAVSAPIRGFLGFPISPDTEDL